MKITVLGTSAAYSGKNEGCSSYIISNEGKNFLIDTGPGCVSFLQNYIGFKDIDGILISHLHADHVSDIYTLRYAIYTAQRDGLMEGPVPIYVPKSPKKTFKFISEIIKDEFSIVEINENLSLSLGGMDVHFKKAKHPIDTYSIKFTQSANKTAKTLVYTADTGYHEGLVSFSRNADVIIADATLQNADRELEKLGHMTAQRAGMFARDSNTDRLVLTHIWPVYDKNISIEEAKQCFKKKIVLARRGLKIDL
jgi:ribonuclease BN (tRNA processing enzyme)